MDTFNELEHGRIFLEHEMSGITAVIEDHIGLPVFGRDTSVNAPPEILLGFAPPRKDGETCDTHTHAHTHTRKK